MHEINIQFSNLLLLWSQDSQTTLLNNESERQGAFRQVRAQGKAVS